MSNMRAKREEALLGVRKQQKPYNLPKIQPKPLTDLEKWKKHLSEMQIQYEQRDGKEIKLLYDEDNQPTGHIEQPTIVLVINECHLDGCWNASVYIVFDIHGKFMYFSPTGE